MRRSPGGRSDIWGFVVRSKVVANGARGAAICDTLQPGFMSHYVHSQKEHPLLLALRPKGPVPKVTAWAGTIVIIGSKCPLGSAPLQRSLRRPWSVFYEVVMQGWRRFSLLAVSAGLAAACGGNDLSVPPTEGAATVTTATSGAEPDGDGYAVQIDGNPAEPIAASGSVQAASLTPGSHSVLLSGIAPNCTVADNPRSVTITAGERATVAFEVTCNPTTGSVRVAANTSGPSPDEDGYTVTLDGVEGGTLSATGELVLDGLAPGDHVIGLSGIAANCQLQGENLRIIGVTAGVRGDLPFTIACVAPSPNAGTLHITTATTGADPDANGYTFAIDAGTAQPIGPNGSTNIGNVTAGTHSVRLSGLAGNCSVQADNPQSLTLASGQTGNVSFAISCTASNGTVRVNVTTSGSSTDRMGIW